MDPMKLCLGQHFYSKFSSLFVFVKLSDPAALKLKKWPQELNLSSFILVYIYIYIYIYIYNK